MKNFLKTHFKLILGIAAIFLVLIVFFVVMRSQQNLSERNLRDWLSASDSRRAAAATILAGTADNADAISKCITKMASLPDSGNFKVRDAAALCTVGIALKADDDEQ